MSLENMLEAQVTINKNLLSRVEYLEKGFMPTLDHMNLTLIFWTSTWLASADLNFRASLLERCELLKKETPPDFVVRDDLVSAVTAYMDFIEKIDYDADKIMPAWFKGVVQGGGNVEPADDLQE